MSRLFRRRPNLLLMTTVGLLSFMAIINVFPFIFVDFGYLTRPLWDERQVRFDKVIVHHYTEGMSLKERCEVHGWTLLPSLANPSTVTTSPKVYDAVIFSVELDMLEIRIRELWDVVDKFIILESNATFTGLPKDEVFKMNMDRFEFAKSKIVYKSLPLSPLGAGESAWMNEGRMRDGMTDFLLEAGVQAGDLVTSSDVDEIISRNTIELLKSCDGVPETIHLQLKDYMYSYEFPIQDAGTWQTSVNKWWPGYSRYIHSQASRVLLTDAGWHCSFCFRTIEEFQFKMQAYSHADRVRYSYLMTGGWIQEAICEGKDLFGMFPEAYSFKELFSRLGSIPKSTTAIGLPKWVLVNRERFRFLLPGGCQREGIL
ncbi:hypothetical protein BGZ46_003652 [Entomortierella lignicola]|nr:hypothetical protein BGZ46_003652 [Entomortierella lignicola]